MMVRTDKPIPTYSTSPFVKFLKIFHPSPFTPSLSPDYPAHQGRCIFEGAFTHFFIEKAHEQQNKGML